jgi:class 3 adenylate cyclase/tetratricopeptide (TPR) repeat protein
MAASAPRPVRRTTEAGRCLYCGEPLRRGQPTCPSCGEPVVQGERKLVSVLFADLTGYTALASSLDPEDVYTFVRPAMTALRLRVESFGGSVPQLLGDGFMAVFGVPTAHEDDPERAVRAALDVVRHVQQLNADRKGMKLPEVHAGVNTGEVLVAGSREASGFAVVGDTVNVASRLADLAPGGHVFVSQSTKDMTAHAVRYADPIGRKMKGKRGLVPAFEALDTLSPVPAGHITPSRAAPFVGRAALLRKLRSEQRNAARRRASRIVLVLGEAGVGKSRLATEFLGGLSEGSGVYGRCPPYGQTLPMFALAQAIREAVGLTPDASGSPADAVLDGFARRLAGRGWRSMAQTLRFLLGFGGRPSSQAPPDPEERTVAARVVLEAMARRGPVVAVLDDVHWADGQLLDFLQNLSASPCNGAVLVVALGRPEVAGRLPGLAAIELHALDEADARAMLDQTLGIGLPQWVTSRILARAAGNPLFLEESARMLAESGTLVRSNGTWTVADPDGVDHVPETLRALIAARLDAIPPNEKRVLQDASVTGEVVWDALIARLSGEPDAATTLEALDRRGLLLRRPHSSMTGVAEFEFKHGLIRDVAYESLPRAERALRHLIIADWLRERSASTKDEPVSTIAHHYEQAWTLSRSRARWAAPGATAELAAMYLKRAGDEALAYQPRVAHALYQSGLKVAAEAVDAVDPATEGELLVGAAETAVELGEHRTAIQIAGKALDAAEAVGLRELRARALLALGRAHSDLGELERARALLADALGLFEAMGDAAGEAWTVYRLSEASRFDDFRGQVELLRRSYDLFHAAGESWGEAMTGQELAYLLTLTGGSEFELRFGEARKLAENEGAARSRAALTRIWGYHAYYKGEYADALRSAREAGPLATQAGDRWVEVDALLLEAMVEAAVGAPEDGERLAGQLVHIAREAGTRHLNALALEAGARPAMRGGRPALGKHRLRLARRTLRSLGVVAEMAEVDLVEAGLLLDQGAWDRAFIAAESGVGIARENGWSLFEAQGLVQRGRAQLGAGRPEAAREALALAVATCETAGASGWLSLGSAALTQASILVGRRPPSRRARTTSAEVQAIRAENDGLLSLRTGNAMGAAEQFEVAVHAWEQLGLTAWLARAWGWHADALRQARRGRGGSRSLRTAEEILRTLASPARGRGGVWHPVPSGAR